MSQWSSHFFHGLFKNLCGYVIKPFAGRPTGFKCVVVCNISASQVGNINKFAA